LYQGTRLIRVVGKKVSGAEINLLIISARSAARAMAITGEPGMDLPLERGRRLRKASDFHHLLGRALDTAVAAKHAVVPVTRQIYRVTAGALEAITGSGSGDGGGAFETTHRASKDTVILNARHIILIPTDG
jgi:hypothetical protein